MKVSGKEVADSLLKKLKLEIKTNKLKPQLAIILAGDNPASRIYVNNKIKTADEVGIRVRLFDCSESEQDKCLDTIDKLNNDSTVHGIIIQYPVYDSWNFDEIVLRISPKKDVDGFLTDSPFRGATAQGVWEMLGAFAKYEGFKTTEDFLKDKKIVILGKGKTAGGPTIRLLREKGLEVTVVDSKTKNRDEVITKGDVVISATGMKNIVNGKNLKKGAYVVGVGIGQEEIAGKQKIYGDINEEEISKKAKLYCPTIGGIGPLTIACLLRNVVESCEKQ